MKNPSRLSVEWGCRAGNLLTSLILFILLFFPFSPAAATQATSVPWSGYWWPFINGGLGTGTDYRDHPAPLEKYNLLTTGVTTGQALTAYMNTDYDPTAPSWYGLCAYWARAACFEHVNIFPSVEDNIVFRVGDKKGLLTLAHSNDIVEVDDGSRPEVFHYWLLHYIGDLQKSFAADLSAGVEVWSYPIYRYEMQFTGSGSTQSVKTTVYFADDFVSADYIGTQAHSATYTYDLFLDGSGAITGGQWTGYSVSDHPEVLTFPLSVGTGFPGLDYQTVYRLSRSSDDALENGGDAVDIAPGTYNLVLLDEDVYRISPPPGDTFSLRVEKVPGSWKDMTAVITDGNGGEVLRQTVTTDAPVNETITAAAPPYTIHLTQENYTTDPNVYTLTLDLKRAFSQEAPYIPKSGGEWSGFALTNPGQTAVEGVTLTTGDGEGAPLRTLLGPIRLEPGEKRRFFFSDFSIPMHELIETERVTLSADGPVALLNLIGSGNDFLTTLVQGEARGNHLIIPDTAAPLSASRMFGGVRNEGFGDAAVRLSVYSAAGVQQQDVTETIAGRGYIAVKPGSSPFFDMPASGWIEVQADEGSVLSGFQYLSSAFGVETLFALPLRGEVKKIVPHIARPGYWTTQVTLINPNDSENPVRFHLALAGADKSTDYNIVLAPREKRTLEIQDLFARPQGDPLYHSILEITGLHQLAGYYTYSVPGGSDNASYPLLDESAFQSVLQLPHYAGNSSWWTGVVVCNPSTVSRVVQVEPYDLEGKLMTDAVQTINLNAGAYDVFDVRSRFGAAAANISFMTFRAADSGAIGGFYLYGNSVNSNILSGANM